MEEPDSFENEKEFCEVVKEVVKEIVRENLGVEPIILKDFGLDLAILIPVGKRLEFRFIECKTYSSSKGRVHIGNGDGGGRQVEILSDDRYKKILNSYIRWVFVDLEEEVDSSKRFAILDNEEVRQYIMGELSEGKQNNLNWKKIKINHGVDWESFVNKLKDFLLFSIGSKKKLRIKVKEIKGRCPVFQKGDEFFIENGYILKLTKSICFHSLSSIFPYYVALSRGIKPEELGLGQKGLGYVQCLDPCEYTGGGTVIFEIEVLD